MASNFDTSRNKFRRVAAYGGRFPPKTDSIVDTDGTTSIIDLNTVARHYDPYMIGAFNMSSLTGEYQEALVSLFFQDSFTVTFSSSFSATPYAIVEIYPSGSSTDFVNAYLTSISTTGLTFGLSAKTTGTARYKAIYASSYPARVERTPLFPGMFATASAGAVTMTNETTVNMTFSGFSGAPEEHTMLPYAASSNEQDVYPDRQVLSTTGSIAELSSHLNGSVHWIALKT